MIDKNRIQFSQTAIYALLASIMAVAVLLLSFFAAEPVISHGQDATSNDFSITQTITDQNSFQTINDVTMVGDINGVTGGNATGTAQVVVISNNAAGYTVDIDFEDNGSGEAMQGDETGTNEIQDYSASTMQPSYGFTTGTAAEFAYNVTSSTSEDTDPSFEDNGAACNQPAGDTYGNCWMAPSTTPAYVIIDASDAAATGATSSITFKVHVPNGATPIPQAQTYTATATLTMTIK